MASLKVHSSPAAERIVAALRGVLPPTARVEILDESGADSLLRLNGRRLSVRWVPRGWPRDLTNAFNQRPLPDVVIAPRMSPGAQEVARRHSVGWLDESGAAEISTPTLLVVRSGSHRFTPEPSGWRPSTLGISEALLSGVRGTVDAISRATGYSPRSAQVGLAFLEMRGLLVAEKRRGPDAARSVAEWDRLLDEYAEAAARLAPPLRLEVGILWRDPASELRDLGDRWAQRRISWAVTGAMAASLVAPLLTTVSSADVFVDARTEPALRLVAEAGGREPMAAGRLILRPFPSAGTRNLTTDTDGLRLAPWPRIFADLRHLGVRGEEAAEHLRDLRRPTS